MASNFPPGVTESMIPGNRPEDLEWEQLWDWVAEEGIEIDYVREAIENYRGCKEMFVAIERLYPNWNKFRDLAEAVQIHNETRDAVLVRLRQDNDALRLRLAESQKEKDQPNA